MLDAAQALALLARAPGGQRLLAVLGDHPEARLVGGAVRDLLRGTIPTECDLVVEGEPLAVAEAIGTVAAEHPRFGVVIASSGELRCDVVGARRERYPEPGSLPEVEPASLEEDLMRRDFTVNAIALGADGVLHSADGALADLRDGRLRVLHERSFRDDPTRLWRLVRYAVRFGFLPEPETDRWAHEAVAAGALSTVSRERLTAELRLALVEPSPLDVLHAAQNLGLTEGLVLDPVVTAAAVNLVDGHGSTALTILGSCLADSNWSDAFAFPAAERRILDRCAAIAPLGTVPPLRPSDVDHSLAGEPVEAVAVAGARGSSAAARLWLGDWRRRAPAIDGDSLKAAGVPEGRDVGIALAAVRDALLDGELPPDADAGTQIAYALAALADL